MPSALDTFRAQREAADGVYGRLQEVSELLKQVRQQVDVLAHNEELRAVLQGEQSWLERAERTVAEVRAWRELEARGFWPGVDSAGSLPWGSRWCQPAPRAPAMRSLPGLRRPISQRSAAAWISSSSSSTASSR